MPSHYFGSWRRYSPLHCNRFSHFQVLWLRSSLLCSKLGPVHWLRTFLQICHAFPYIDILFPLYVHEVSLITDGMVVLDWDAYFHRLPPFLLVWCFCGIEVEWSYGSNHNQFLHYSSSKCACLPTTHQVGHAMLLFLTNSLLPCPHPPFSYVLKLLSEGDYNL